MRKKGVKKVGLKPEAKKGFTNVVSKLDTGVKKTKTVVAVRQSDGATAKKKEEMYGRVGTEQLAKFLTGKFTQSQFVRKIKVENGARLDDKGSDFNFIDNSYEKSIPHDVRINKRPITANPGEKFGTFTTDLFSFGESALGQTTLQSLLSLEKQNVIMLDMRGDGTFAQKEFNDFHILGSVSFPHGWINRHNYYCALQRFKNLDNKVILIFMDNERHGTAIAKTLTEKGFGNIYLLTGGI